MASLLDRGAENLQVTEAGRCRLVIVPINTVYLCFAYLCATAPRTSNAHRDQKRVLDPLELDSQPVAMWIWESEAGPCGRAASLNH